MTARMRRIASDWEQVKKDFAGHKNIIVSAVGDEPPEQYRVTYYVNGIYLLPDGRIETQSKHEVEITLHAEYPRYKPTCKILTPIWHPNFKDGQICIGDIWGAGESLSDIIINIGDMIQYRSWNSSSPLSADAAKWAMENKHLFPVGNIDLYIADYASAADTVEIDLFEEESEAQTTIIEKDDANDFEITAEELAGIEFVPTAQRMQGSVSSGKSRGGKVNFKTILVKGLVWGLLGAIIGFGISELTSGITSEKAVAGLLGYSEIQDYYEYNEKADNCFDKINDEFTAYCKKEGLDPNDTDNLTMWYLSDASDEAVKHLDDYIKYSDKATAAMFEAYGEYFDYEEDEMTAALDKIIRIHSGLWFAVISMFIGFFLGLGEGIFYGSKDKAIKFALVGAVVSLVLGMISGYIGQVLYGKMITESSGDFMAALVRAIGWACLGGGVGLAAGLIKPEKKRIIFCMLGGLCGGFAGGFLFNYVYDIIPNDIVSRGVAIVLMGLLIGLGVGLLEQFAKQAWLKVIRGEFEGKEYLVFTGTTSIGNDGSNTIVLFKDKLIGRHHCDIKLEGSQYVLTDCGTPMGTVVNGNKISRHVLHRGDAISIGNSVLIFYTK